MADPKICTPQSVFGTYVQTQFLGCSVLDFSVSAGWNGQASELTVELAQDPCEGSKEYWTTKNGKKIYTEAEITTEADPGFTFPNIGAPAYFRVADFEFTGLIQSYTQKEGTGGTTYSVKLVDPRVILDSTQVILDSYEGTIPNFNTNNAFRNLFNVYGFLEFIQTSNLDDRCTTAQRGVDDDTITNFGAPAGGFGGARRTERGIPWYLIKNALTTLAGKPAGPSNIMSWGLSHIGKFSGGLFYIGGSGRGYGELGEGDSISYVLDLEEVPYSWTWDYRITGPTVSVSDLINQVCTDAGMDYYVELLPVKAGRASATYAGKIQGTILVVKVRTVSRLPQRNLGTGDARNKTFEIQNFINSVTEIDNDGEPQRPAISKTLGRELRTEQNSSFLIGGKTQQYFQTATPANIQPFWGFDTEGNLIQSWLEPTEVFQGYRARLDFRKINLSLYTPLYADDDGQFAWVGENELRFALGDLESFQQAILKMEDVAWYYPRASNLVYEGPTPLQKWMRSLSVFPDLTQEDLYDQSMVIKPKVKANDQEMTNTSLQNTTESNQKNYNLKDIEKMHSWLNSYANEVYGKQFLVAFQTAGIPIDVAPITCSSKDPQWKAQVASQGFGGYTNKQDIADTEIYTDEPSSDGGWPSSYDALEDRLSDAASILQIPFNRKDDPNFAAQMSTLDRFRDDQGKFQVMLAYDKLSNDYKDLYQFIPDASKLDTNEYAVYNDVLYVKGEVDDKWIVGTSNLAYHDSPNPFLAGEAGKSESWRSALITISNPVLEKNLLTDANMNVIYQYKATGPLEINPTEDTPGWIQSVAGMSGIFGAHAKGVGAIAPAAYTSLTRRLMLNGFGPAMIGMGVKSNTQTYGPWVSVGANPGAVNCEIDEGLTPWEYGGIDAMNAAGLSKVTNAVTQMQTAERGEVTIPGYPELSLGSVLLNTDDNKQNYKDREIDQLNKTYGISNSSSMPYLAYQYPSSLKTLAGDISATISNISVTVGEAGVTTSYTMSTFTPVFGRFSKGNAERIKQIGLNRLKSERELRSRQRLRAGFLGSRGGKQSLDPSHSVGKGNIAPSKSPVFTLAGYYHHYSTYDVPEGWPPLTNAVKQPPRKVVIGATQSSLASFKGYEKSAMVTLDALFRPVSKHSMRGPGIYTPTQSTMDNRLSVEGGYIQDTLPVQTFADPEDKPYSGIQVNGQQANLTVAPPGPVSGYELLPITNKYLDYLADYSSNAEFVTSQRAMYGHNLPVHFSSYSSMDADGRAHASGHDIEGVARSRKYYYPSVAEDGTVTRAESEFSRDQEPAGVDGLLTGSITMQDTSADFRSKPRPPAYRDNYRHMALRGPLMLHGWGYDTMGKPIPNAEELASNTMNGRFSHSSYMSDRFQKDWLQNPYSWPCAPIDLRFDRDRGVWTTPPPPRLLHVSVTGSGHNWCLRQGYTKGALVVGNKHGIRTGDANDAESQATEYHVNVTNPFKLPMSGDTLVYYNTPTNQWWPISCFSNNQGDEGTFAVVGKGCNPDEGCSVSDKDSSPLGFYNYTPMGGIITVGTGETGVSKPQLIFGCGLTVDTKRDGSGSPPVGSAFVKGLSIKGQPDGGDTDEGCATAGGTDDFMGASHLVFASGFKVTNIPAGSPPASSCMWQIDVCGPFASGSGGSGAGEGCASGVSEEVTVVTSVECVGAAFEITKKKLTFSKGCLTAVGSPEDE